LAVEDRDDFRVRLESLLKDPRKVWVPIDPEGRVQEQGFNEQNFQKALQQFEMERARNIAWLKTLGTAMWTEVHERAGKDPIRGGDLLASWVCHDALHLTQVANRLEKMAERDAPGFSTAYAR